MRKIVIVIILALSILLSFGTPASAATTQDKVEELWVILNGTNYALSRLEGGATVKEISLSCKCAMDSYKLVIPAGTRVISPGGAKIYRLQFTVYRDNICYFPEMMRLSQPATVYKLVDGEWVKLLSFIF